MVVEELIAKLGLKIGNMSDAKKFVKELDRVKKATKDLGKDIKINLTGNTSGLSKISKDFDRATASIKRFRMEAQRASNVRMPGGGGGFGAGRGGGFGASGRGRTPAEMRRDRHRNGRSVLGDIAEASSAGAGMGMGRAGAVAAGAYAGGRLVSASASSSMNFERKMIEVSKATDAKGAELDAYGQQIMKLARDTGKNKEELAGVLSAGGFAGRPKEELMRFTEFGAKASTAWGTSLDSTADSLAQIGNVYQADQSRIEDIGDQINTMADKSASKEVDLLEILRRAGGSGKMAGMTSGDILGLGASLKGRGVQTEIAASGIESVINFMKLGSKFSKDSEDGMKALGMSDKTLAKNFKAAPMKALLTFLDKLGDIKDAGKLAEILDNIFGKERQDDVARMIDSRADIKKNVEMINDKNNYGGSVRTQFSEQMKYDVSKVDQAVQQWDVMIKRLGDPIKVAMGGLAEQLNKIMDASDKLNAAAKPDSQFNAILDPNHLAGVIEASRRRKAGLAPIAPMSFGAGKASAISPIEKSKGKAGLSMGWNNAGTGSLPQLGGSSFGLGGPKGAPGAWMNQGVKETTTQSITHHYENTGNDQRTQTASVTVNATGLAEVAAQVTAAVKSGLSSLGASIAKTNSTPTITGATSAP